MTERNTRDAPGHLQTGDTDRWLMVEPAGHRAPLRNDQTLLQAAEAAGIDLPASCRNGTCRTCLSHMRQGSVRYPVATWPGISPDERLEGLVLPCVALADGTQDICIQHVGPSGVVPLFERLPDEWR
jgi:ferredoxin